jgi:hypothetical protein
VSAIALGRLHEPLDLDLGAPAPQLGVGTPCRHHCSVYGGRSNGQSVSRGCSAGMPRVALNEFAKAVFVGSKPHEATKNTPAASAGHAVCGLFSACPVGRKADPETTPGAPPWVERRSTRAVQESASMAVDGDLDKRGSIASPSIHPRVLSQLLENLTDRQMGTWKAARSRPSILATSSDPRG